MGKKHKHPEHENLERWLVSYADFITLLFATFVVLYALSQLDLAKFKNVSQGISSAFKNSPLEKAGGLMSGDTKVSVLSNAGNSILQEVVAKFPPNDVKHGSMRPFSDAVSKANGEASKIKQSQAKGSGGENKEKGKGEGSGGGDGVTVEVQNRGVVISLSSGIFFESGSAGLKPEAYKVIDALAPTLKKADQVIHIEGHTDNQPIASAVYPSNWELSAARAGTVVRYLIQKHHFDPKKLATVGYGDSHPKVSNTDPSLRSRNRRVDIVILTPSNAAAVEPSKALDGFSGEGVEINPSASELTPKKPAKNHTSKPAESVLSDTHSEPDKHPKIHSKRAHKKHKTPKTDTHNTNAKEHRIKFSTSKKPFNVGEDIIHSNKTSDVKTRRSEKTENHASSNRTHINSTTDAGDAKGKAESVTHSSEHKLLKTIDPAKSHIVKPSFTPEKHTEDGSKKNSQQRIPAKPKTTVKNDP